MTWLLDPGLALDTKSCSDDGIHEELRELLKYLTYEVENLHFGSVLMTMHFFVVSMT